MFWHKHSAAPAAAASPPIGRSAHLSSYLDHSILKPSTRKIPSSSDDSIYDTVFQTTNGFALIARVYVPADIGTRAPSVTLHGVRASHDWLDIRMKVIGYAPISSDATWRASGLKLGDAVYAVIHHFQLTPPSILDITDNGLQRLQESLSGPTTRPDAPQKASVPPGANGHSRPQNNTSIHPDTVSKEANLIERVVQKVDVDDCEVDALIPPVPSSFPKIDNMPLAELTQLVEKRDVLERFVQSTSVVETLRELTQQIATANVKAANANLAHEAKLEGTCTAVETLQKELEVKMQRYRTLDAERAALTQPPDRHEAIAELTAAKKEAYRRSEELAEHWVESGGEDIGDFVEKFMEVRLIYHTRAAKAERLEQSM